MFRYIKREHKHVAEKFTSMIFAVGIKSTKTAKLSPQKFNWRHTVVFYQLTLIHYLFGVHEILMKFSTILYRTIHVQYQVFHATYHQELMSGEAPGTIHSSTYESLTFHVNLSPFICFPHPINCPWKHFSWTISCALTFHAFFMARKKKEYVVEVVQN